MAKRPTVRPLLAVAAAASLAGCSSNAVPSAATADPAVTAPSAGSAFVTPRVTPSGRPACGNVTMRAIKGVDCD